MPRQLRSRNQLLQTAKVLLVFDALHQLINLPESLPPTPSDFAYVPICKTEAPHPSMPVRRHIDPAVDRRAKNSKDPVSMLLWISYRVVKTLNLVGVWPGFTPSVPM